MMKNFVLIILLINVVRCYCCLDCCCCYEYCTPEKFDKIIEDSIRLYNEECWKDRKIDLKIINFPVTINGLKIEDIEKQEVISDYDLLQSQCKCIVNASSYGFQGGGGIYGAIHENFEFDCNKEMNNLIQEKSPNFVGQSVCTSCEKKLNSQASDSIKYIIHTIAPDLRKISVDKDIRKLYYSCFSTCFDLFQQENIISIDFPLVGCGVYGWSLEQFAIGFFEGFFIKFLEMEKTNISTTEKNYTINICVKNPGERNSSMPDTTTTVKFLALCFKRLLDFYNSKIDPVHVN